MNFLIQFRALAEGIDPSVEYDDGRLQSSNCVYFTFTSPDNASYFQEMINLFSENWKAYRIEVVVQVRRNS